MIFLKTGQSKEQDGPKNTGVPKNGTILRTERYHDQEEKKLSYMIFLKTGQSKEQDGPKNTGVPKNGTILRTERYYDQ